MLIHFFEFTLILLFRITLFYFEIIMIHVKRWPTNESKDQFIKLHTETKKE